jgi:hypothetical protein
MGVEKIRRKLAVAGPVTIGGDAGLQRSAANFVNPLSGDYLGIRWMGAGTAPGTANLGVANNGALALGNSAGTIRLGFIVNGTCYVMEGTAGGAVAFAAVNPAGG